MGKRRLLDARSIQRQALLDAVFARDGARCHWCSKTVRRLRPKVGPHARDMATLDHLLTRGAGGKDVAANVVLACYACNHERGDLPVELWRALLRSRNALPEAAE